MRATLKSVIRIGILLAVIAFVAGCGKLADLQENNLKTDQKQTLYGMSYGSDARHTLDIALPKNRTDSTPVVIFIHGGAWVFGDKGVFATEIQQFADAGIACATINYRFASDINHIHHPELPEDVRKAIDYIASKSSKWKVSPSRFGIVGHSAGGHLSLITSYTFNQDGKIKACASWAGPVDFIDSTQLAISGAHDIFKTYTGKPLQSYSDTLAYKEASPYWKVTAASVPTKLVYATADELVPYSTCLKMEQQLNTLGVTHSRTTLQGATHVWSGSYLDSARSATLQWFKGKL